MKKLLLNLVCAVGFLNPVIQASYGAFNAQGKTPLIAYVIAQEAAITYIKSDIDRLWHVCYEYVNVKAGYVIDRISDDRSISRPMYKRELRRRLSCTDQDIIAHKQRQKDLGCTIAAAVSGIRNMAQSGYGAHPAVADYAGYTAINYCYTREIYDELIRIGVPFQWKVWIYFNPGYTMLACAATVVGGMATYSYVTSR